MNTLKERLKLGKVALGAWNMIDNFTVAEILANTGVAWVAIDMEHGTGITQLIPRIAAIEAAGCTPLCRLPAKETIYFKQALDSGAAGIIAPMINYPTDARAVVLNVKYPPNGVRGVGVCRAHGHGAYFQEYVDQADPLIVVQIEHIRAVEYIDQICMEDIDVAFIGPYDLSGSIGLLGQTHHPDVEDAIARVTEAVNKVSRVALGIHIVEPQPGELERRIAEGYRFIALGLDTTILRNGMINLQ